MTAQGSTIVFLARGGARRARRGVPLAARWSKRLGMCVRKPSEGLEISRHILHVISGFRTTRYSVLDYRTAGGNECSSIDTWSKWVLFLIDEALGSTGKANCSCSRRGMHKTAQKISLLPSSSISHTSSWDSIFPVTFSPNFSPLLAFILLCFFAAFIRFKGVFALVSRNQVWEFPQVSSCRWWLSSQLSACQKHTRAHTHVRRQLRLCDHKRFRDRVWLAYGSKCLNLYWPEDFGSAKQES